MRRTGKRSQGTRKHNNILQGIETRKQITRKNKTKLERKLKRLAMKNGTNANNENYSILRKEDNRLQGGRTTNTDCNKIKTQNQTIRKQRGTIRRDDARDSQCWKTSKRATKTIPFCEEQKTYCKEVETRQQIARRHRHEHRLQGCRDTNTDCTDVETRTQIARTRHENRLQGRRGTTTDCKEVETRKQIARKQRHGNRLQGSRVTQTECNEVEARNHVART